MKEEIVREEKGKETETERNKEGMKEKRAREGERE